MRKFFLTSAFLVCSVSLNAFATDNSVCTPVAMKSQNKEITLPGPEEPKTVKVYFFKNLTTKGIWLDHPVAHASASAGWSSYFRAGNASALLVNRKNFAISCAVITPGKVESLNCEKAVSVCVMNKTPTAVRKGTYWLVEDKPWHELVLGVEKKNGKGT